MNSATLVPLLGFAVGLALGATARWTDFCMRGAIEDMLTTREAPRLRGFALAVVVALVGVQALALTGTVDLTKSLSLPKAVFWGGALVGGAMFGVGMVLTGGCGTRLLVLAASGNLRATVTVVLFAMVAYATLRGILAPVRGEFAALATIPFPQQSLPLVAGAAIGLAALALALWRRGPIRHLAGGVGVGLLIPISYYITGRLGADDFNPAPTESLGVTRTAGESVVYLLTYTGAKISFGVAFVFGIPAGAALVAALTSKFKLEGFERPADMGRYALGALFMGFGGVCAMGCTIGNGLTGLASLSPGALIATPAMVLAAAATMRWRQSRRASVLA